MRLAFVPTIFPAVFLLLVSSVDAVDAPRWLMPASFAFGSMTDFWWPIVPGVNLVGMYIRRVRDPAGKVELPLAPCAVTNVEEQKCEQYVNNGTAKFGGYFAQGLIPGEQYFISITWITEDSSKNGTESSPAFTMDLPAGMKTLTNSSQLESKTESNTATVTVAAKTTTTIRLELAPSPTTLSTLATPDLPSPTENVDLFRSINQSQEQRNQPSQDTLHGGIIASIILAVLAGFACMGGFFCWCSRQNFHREVRQAIIDALKRVKHEPGYPSNDNNDGYMGTVEKEIELPGQIWDGTNELAGSRGGIEMDGSHSVEGGNADRDVDSGTAPPQAMYSPGQLTSQEQVISPSRNINGIDSVGTASPVSVGTPIPASAGINKERELGIDRSTDAFNQFVNMDKITEGSTTAYELDGVSTIGPPAPPMNKTHSSERIVVDGMEFEVVTKVEDPGSEGLVVASV